MNWEEAWIWPQIWPKKIPDLISPTTVQTLHIKRSVMFKLVRVVFITKDDVLLNLSASKGKEIKCEACQALIAFSQQVLSKFQYYSSRIYRGYSNFWNEYAIYFIEWSEKCIFHEWRSHQWNIHFLASRDEINCISIPKIWIFFLLYTILSVTDFCALNDVIHVCTLCQINDDVA